MDQGVWFDQMSVQLSAKHKAGASVQDSEASGRMARAWNV